ncbi:MAG TPA: acetyl-CoA C-acyltransferase, partial [Actinomycetota bacterium]|nr:acetyl-CoA C-acyltransferase [Actinomycetota bacterium]
MREAYVVDAIRTPMGRFGGALAEVRPDDLAAHVIAELVRRNEVEGALVDEVVWGAANQAGEDNRNVARMALLLAGLPVEVPGVTVNRLCGSGLEAVNAGYRLIRSEEAELVIAGGSESMTRAPFVMSKASAAYQRQTEIYDTSIGWRFVNPRMHERYGSHAMGETAEINGRDYAISRAEQDAFALESHHRAVLAREEGRFKDEIVPVQVPQRKGDPVVLDEDEPPRPDTTLEKLARLKPAFEEGGTVTAGNSSGINDGAAAVLIASQEAVRANGWEPLARIVTSAVAGVEPQRMGTGPIHATRKALKRAGLDLADIDLIELNEAFAAQSLACIKELGLDRSKVNVNGGAIALGHPLGCSGARILTTLVHEMDRREVRRGLATMCIGVGQGIATI